VTNIAISILIPARNEAENLPALLTEITTALSGRNDYEIVVVDDGSSDETFSVLRSAQDKGMSVLRILRHSRSLGQSTCIYRAAQRAKGVWLVTLDGDGQNDPADIPGLLRLVEGSEGDNEGIKLIAGHRVTRRDSWIKRISSRIANAIRSRILQDDTPDTGCGLKVMARDSFLQLPYFDHMHRFIPALMQRHGFRKLVAPVNHRPRRGGQSNYGTIDRALVGIVDLFGVSWLLRRTRFHCKTEEATATSEKAGS
jgi:dolichol-phosphate mannosyltransferase